MTKHLDITSPATPASLAPGPRLARPGWRRPVLLAAVAVVGVAGVAGVGVVRAMTTADGSPSVGHVARATATEPFMSPAEQAYIKARISRVAVVPAAVDPWCAVNRPC